ncbi:MAG: DNA helicase RecG, partial [Candidatus Colwellbacteria bacterium]|nr:DNA helicase RecG [Candidatus Colwellbacteria bacterium]
LAMVVIDEQHRFGISQRATLVKNKNLVPHLLSMTATPIPRTLALTIYGDLDISLIKEKPKNRQKIITKVVTASEKKDCYQFVRSEIKNGRQVFVVCPRIESSEPGNSGQNTASQSKKISKQFSLWQEVKAVQEEYKKLSETVFPDLRVAMLHGKLKPKEKIEIMDKFRNGGYDMLVSTSVIEVGVDVPNATIMAIESAERFGLAQLHQFRGRVGRGEHQSYCVLFSSTKDRSINKRLKALVDCDDGFELAEKDMAIRGPGEFMGTKQSGMPDLVMASLANIELIKKARLEARLLLKENPSLSRYPLLLERFNEFQKMTHFE